MATYIVLSNFTEQGMRNVSDAPSVRTPSRNWRRSAAPPRKSSTWTLGKYDVVAIFEAPDEASITALGLAIGVGGYVRSTDDARLHQRRD